MYFHYINDQKKYETKTISEKKFLNYYAVKNDVHDVKGTASNLCLPVTGPRSFAGAKISRDYGV